MFCKFCGNQISDNSTTCSYCGKQVIRAESNGVPNPPPTPEPSVNPVPPDSEKKKGKGLLIALGIILVVLFIVVGVLLYIYLSQPGEPGETSASEVSEAVTEKPGSAEASADEAGSEIAEPVYEESAVIMYVDNVLRNADLRRDSNGDSAIFDVIPIGTAVEYLGTTGDYAKIKYGGEFGYILSSQLSETEPNLTPVSVTYVANTGYYLKLYGGPFHDATDEDDDDDEYIKVYLDTELEFIEIVEEYSKVKYGDSYGYIKTKFTSNTPPLTTVTGTRYTIANGDIILREYPSYYSDSLGVVGNNVLVEVIADGYGYGAPSGYMSYVYTKVIYTDENGNKIMGYIFSKCLT